LNIIIFKNIVFDERIKDFKSMSKLSNNNNDIINKNGIKQPVNKANLNNRSKRGNRKSNI
jgi:hypothetical protein